jgi:RadC-like JAB domain
VTGAPAPGSHAAPPGASSVAALAPPPAGLLPPEAAATLHLVRENLRLLADLTARNEAARPWPPPGCGPLPPSSGTLRERTFRSPGDVAAYLGPELAGSPQEQLRALLLTTRMTLLGCVLVTQGTSNRAPCRVADAFREAVRAGASRTGRSGRGRGRRCPWATVPLGERPASVTWKA